MMNALIYVGVAGRGVGVSQLITKSQGGERGTKLWGTEGKRREGQWRVSVTAYLGPMVNAGKISSLLYTLVQ